METQLESESILTLVIAPVILLLSHLGSALAAGAVNPLTPADTSSPRATLSGFVEAVNTAHAQLEEILKSYLSSSRLYLSAEERMESFQINRKPRARRRSRRRRRKGRRSGTEE